MFGFATIHVLVFCLLICRYEPLPLDEQCSSSEEEDKDDTVSECNVQQKSFNIDLGRNSKQFKCIAYLPIILFSIQFILPSGNTKRIDVAVGVQVEPLGEESAKRPYGHLVSCHLTSVLHMCTTP